MINELMLIIIQTLCIAHVALITYGVTNEFLTKTERPQPNPVGHAVMLSDIVQNSEVLQ